MPELVENGPYIPTKLLNELDDGNVVFFCGAGISMGTGLPSFGGLVDHVYTENRLEPDEIEREALDCGIDDPKLRRPKYDKVLGLLERPERLGPTRSSDPSRMRDTIVRRLSERSTGPLHVHRALVTLSSTTKGVRLVTTNFDNRFHSAGVQNKFIDSAPKLPVPKAYGWHSLVHLHGRIGNDLEDKDLVLTAADFGRAYLTERWAARFVTELFREFTVVFVGYSLDDPVMSYLVDALAAERSRGIRFNEAYAFAGFQDEEGEYERSMRGWQAKNVQALLYSDESEHEFLNDTLIEWARIKKDPFNARAQIALSGVRRLPDGPNDSLAERVTWAVQSPVASKALADAPPIVEGEDYPKVGAWIEVWHQAGLFGQPERTNNGSGEETIPIVGAGFHATSRPPLSETSRFLAIWLARHLHVPEVLEWTVRQGGFLHPQLADFVRAQLARPTNEEKPEPKIDPYLKTIWSVLAYRQATPYNISLWIAEQYRSADSEAEKAVLQRRAFDLIRPKLLAKPGPRDSLKYSSFFGGHAPEISPAENCAHLELVISESDHLDFIENVVQAQDFLAKFAFGLTNHLESALELKAFIHGGRQPSLLERPSIAEHQQNEHRGKLSALINTSGKNF